MFKTKQFGNVEFLRFEFVSDFDIRISDFYPVSAQNHNFLQVHQSLTGLAVYLPENDVDTSNG